MAIDWRRRAIEDRIRSLGPLTGEETPESLFSGELDFRKKAISDELAKIQAELSEEKQRPGEGIVLPANVDTSADPDTIPTRQKNRYRAIMREMSRRHNKPLYWGIGKHGETAFTDRPELIAKGEEVTSETHRPFPIKQIEQPEELNIVPAVEPEQGLWDRVKSWLPKPGERPTIMGMPGPERLKEAGIWPRQAKGEVSIETAAEVVPQPKEPVAPWGERVHEAIMGPVLRAAEPWIEMERRPMLTAPTAVSVEERTAMQAGLGLPVTEKEPYPYPRDVGMTIPEQIIGLIDLVGPTFFTFGKPTFGEGGLVEDIKAGKYGEAFLHGVEELFNLVPIQILLGFGGGLKGRKGFVDLAQKKGISEPVAKGMADQVFGEIERTQFGERAQAARELRAEARGELVGAAEAISRPEPVLSEAISPREDLLARAGRVQVGLPEEPTFGELMRGGKPLPRPAAPLREPLFRGIKEPIYPEAPPAEIVKPKPEFKITYRGGKAIGEAAPEMPPPRVATEKPFVREAPLRFAEEPKPAPKAKAAIPEDQLAREIEKTSGELTVAEATKSPRLEEIKAKRDKLLDQRDKILWAEMNKPGAKTEWAIETKEGKIISDKGDRSIFDHADLVEKSNINFDDVKSTGYMVGGKYRKTSMPEIVREAPEAKAVPGAEAERVFIDTSLDAEEVARKKYAAFVREQGKERWQMTRAEYSTTLTINERASEMATGWREYRQIIRAAHSEGKPVPPEVLAEYPELVKAAPAEAKAAPVKEKPIKPEKPKKEKPAPQPASQLRESIEIPLLRQIKEAEVSATKGDTLNAIVGDQTYTWKAGEDWVSRPGIRGGRDERFTINREKIKTVGVEGMPTWVGKAEIVGKLPKGDESQLAYLVHPEPGILNVKRIFTLMAKGRESELREYITSYKNRGLKVESGLIDSTGKFTRQAETGKAAKEIPKPTLSPERQQWLAQKKLKWEEILTDMGGGIPPKGRLETILKGYDKPGSEYHGNIFWGTISQDELNLVFGKAKPKTSGETLSFMGTGKIREWLTGGKGERPTPKVVKPEATELPPSPQSKNYRSFEDAVAKRVEEIRARGEKTAAKEIVIEEGKEIPRLTRLYGEGPDINISKLPLSREQKGMVIEGAEKMSAIPAVPDLETITKAKAIRSDLAKMDDIYKRLYAGKALDNFEMQAGRIDGVEKFIKVHDDLRAGKYKTEAQYETDLAKIIHEQDLIKNQPGLALHGFKIPLSIDDMAINAQAIYDSLMKHKGMPEHLKAELRKIDLRDVDALRKFRDKLPDKWPHFIDYFNEFLYFNFLSGPMTHARNFLFNMAKTFIAQPATKLSEGALSFIRHPLDVSKRTHFVSELGPYYKAAYGQLPFAWKGTKKIFRGEMPPADISKFQYEMGKVYYAWRHSPWAWMRKVSPVLESTTRGLVGMDFFTRSMSYYAHLRAIAYREARIRGYSPLKNAAAYNKWVDEFVSNPSTKAIKELGNKAKAESTVLASESVVMEEPGKIGKWLESRPDLLRWMLPFVRTPLRLKWQEAELTPVFNIFTIPRLVRQGRYAEIISKQIQGALLFYYFLNKAEKGELTGTYDVSRRNIAEAGKYREGRIKYGNTWIDLNNIPLLGTVARAAADFHYQRERWKRGEVKLPDAAAKVFLGSLNQFIHQTYVQQLGRYADAIMEKSVEKAKSAAQWQLTGLVPGAQMMGWLSGITEVLYGTKNIHDLIDRLSNPQLPVRQYSKEWGKGTIQHFQARIPFESRKVAQKLDIFGRPVYREAGIYNPYGSDADPKDPVINELRRLDMGLGQPQRRFTRDKIDYELNDEDYAELKKRMGKEAYDTIKWEIGLKGYQNAKATEMLTKEQVQAQFIDEELNKYRGKIRKDFIDDVEDKYYQEKLKEKRSQSRRNLPQLRPSASR